jgi:GR25 family glycosyltransferase involved in LPS biosynthesis
MILKKSLNFSFDSEIESTYVIYLPKNEISKSQSQRCIDSCQKLNIPCQLYEGFDGTDGKNIKVPKSLEKQGWLKWIKILNPELKITEVCCFLSHLSLWIKCIELDKPIIILEHDAVMIKKYTHHVIPNCIMYLGSSIQLKSQNFGMVYGQLNQNYRFMYCTHAYSIDPLIAKNLLSSVIKTGITHTLDSYMRSDFFTIYQSDFFAFDDSQNLTTIHDCKNIMLNNFVN